jgi:hypothetical protein
MTADDDDGSSFVCPHSGHDTRITSETKKKSYLYHSCCQHDKRRHLDDDYWYVYLAFKMIRRRVMEH